MQELQHKANEAFLKATVRRLDPQIIVYLAEQNKGQGKSRSAKCRTLFMQWPVVMHLQKNMKNKKPIYLLTLPILNLLVLLFILELNESLIILPIALALFYLSYSIKISKKYKNEGLNTLFILSYLAILFFPTFHFIGYQINENNYYLSDYLKDSANHRLEDENSTMNTIL